MPTTDKRPLKVFLCHASTDKPKVRELYRYLRRRGINPWFDEIDLIGGQDWQVEIPKALTTSDAIIICLTKNSVDKEGYIQKEIKFALDRALEMPEGRIFLIPVRFEECEVPFSLSRYQWVDLTIESGYAKMMKALKFRASQLERSTVEVSKKDVDEEDLTREKKEREAAVNNASEKAEKESAEKARLIAEEEIRQMVAREKEEQEASEKIAREKLQRQIEKRTRDIQRKYKREIFLSRLRSKLSLFSLYLRHYIFPAILLIGAALGVLYLGKPFFDKALSPTQDLKATQTFTSLPSQVVTETIAPSETSTPLDEFLLLGGTPVANISSKISTDTMGTLEMLAKWNVQNELPFFSQDGSLIALVNEQQVEVLDIFSNETVGEFSVNARVIDAISFSNDNKLLVVSSSTGYATQDAVVQIWDIDTKNLIKTITLPTSTSVNSLDISPDNNKILIGLFTGYSKVFEIQTGKELLTSSNQFNVTNVVFSPDGSTFASGGGDWISSDPGLSLLIYDLESKKLLHTLEGNAKAVRALVYSSDAEVLASGALDGRIILWETDSGNLIRVLNAKEKVDELAFTADGQILVSSAGNSAQLWKVSDGNLLKTIDNLGGEVNNLAFTDDGTILFIGTKNGEISAWGTSNIDSQPEITSTPLPTEIIDAEGVPMALVPAGEFTMGSDELYHVGPAHTVYLDVFYIDKYEVSNAEYAKCVVESDCLPPRQMNSLDVKEYYGNPDYDSYPVIYVTWDMANSYCTWRGKKDNKNVRLPTEAEWEKSARSTDKRRYPWGDSKFVLGGNFCDMRCPSSWDADMDDGYRELAPVSSFSKGVSSYGIYNMAGNVWEWVADWYVAYENEYSNTLSNPLGPQSGTDRVVRGGSWKSLIFQMETTYRTAFDPLTSDNNLGFRCAMDAP